MFIVDAHLDLAYNALHNGRDLLKPVEDVRRAERKAKVSSRLAIVTFPELRSAGVGLVFGSVFAAPAAHYLFRDGGPLVYKSPDEAFHAGQRQLDYYHRLADEVDYIRLVTDQEQLDTVVESHGTGAEPLIGVIPLMEGADPIREPEEAELWHERGLRVIGLAWDDTRYSAGGWRSNGGLTRDGRRLLEVMADLGFILDLTHMSDLASVQALDSYEGTIIASHSNARALVPGTRQLDDGLIRQIGEREGVIGIALCNSFLKTGHRLGDPKAAVTLDHVAAHIDHICQCVGSAAHVGIGSDFDGGFGLDDIPAELSSLAQLPLIGKVLEARGYTEQDVANIMGGNWLRVLTTVFASQR